MGHEKCADPRFRFHSRMGRVEVSCEGYDNPDDPYVLKGKPVHGIHG
jgi:hypothetical protein